MSSSSKPTAKTSGLPPQDLLRVSPAAFSEALSKIVSIPRTEMQTRLDSSPKESSSKHTRYKYVRAKPPQNP